MKTVQQRVIELIEDYSEVDGSIDLTQAVQALCVYFGFNPEANSFSTPGAQEYL